MKKGTLYAKKLKKALGRIRGSATQKPAPCADAIEQLIVGVFSQETSIERAHRAMHQLLRDMVDYNELRVSTPAEVATSIQKHVPNSVQRGRALVALLNAIYKTEYTVSLDRIASLGVRDIKGYLEKLDGITPYVSAHVLLWSLGGHAIPVNDVTLEMLRRNDLVDSGADTAEVQAFLERHISAADAQDLTRDLEAYAMLNKKASAAASSSRSSSETARKKTAPRKSTAKTSRKTTKSAKAPKRTAKKGKTASGKGKTTRKKRVSSR